MREPRPHSRTHTHTQSVVRFSLHVRGEPTDRLIIDIAYIDAVRTMAHTLRVFKLLFSVCAR